jgi:hypothetical protein
METILKAAAEESIGKVTRDIRNGWFDQKCEQVTVEKNKKYQSMLQRKFTRAARECCKARRTEKRIHNKKKDYYEKQLKWLQECDSKNDSRQFYQVTRTRDGFQAKPLSCRSTDGDILSDKVDILNIWKEYFRNLYGTTEDNA